MTTTTVPPTNPPPLHRWWSLTTSGSVTALIGTACLVALVAQEVVRGNSASLVTLTLAGVVVAVLIALDRLVERRSGGRAPLRLAVAAIVGHALLVEALTLLDGLTYTALMYLTLPFPACFLLGQRAGLAVSVALLGWFTLKFSLLKPGWPVDSAAVNTFLLFVVALALLTAMAQVVQRERASRQRAEDLLRDLDRSHRELAASHAQVLRASSQVAELATIAERNRLARDIHDSLGHSLTVIGVQLEKALLVADEDPAALRAAIGHAKRMTDQALRDVRESVGTLRRDATPFVLTTALERLVSDLGALPFAIRLSISGDEGSYTRQQLLALYRTAQEGLTNVQKHAQAREARLAVVLGEREAMLRLEDDGVGPGDEVVGGRGTGLQGVRERLELVSGRLTVAKAPVGGTLLEARVPRVGGGRDDG